MAPPVVLTIAGFDPSSGAGITADIKTLAAHGCYGVACITALTIQTTQGVFGVHPVDPEIVRKTLAVLADDFPLAAVRIGMLGSGAVAEAVADFLQRTAPPHVVVDPVLQSSSGASLLDEPGRLVLRQRLLAAAELVTPNAAEAASLASVPVETPADMKQAAARFHELGAKAVVITGGDWPEPTDLLSVRQAGTSEQELFADSRIASWSTHGTGCAFATAIAANLALGNNLRDAVVAARAYVRAAIARAYTLGRGTGPVNHLYGWDKS